MKKNPIDELFAKKLAEHRQEPSQKALEKFQERLAQREQKRRGGVFVWNRQWNYYAAAASVIAVLSIGVLSIRDNSPQLADVKQDTVKSVAKKDVQKNVPIYTQKTTIESSKVEEFQGSVNKQKTSFVNTVIKTEATIAQAQPEVIVTEPIQTNTTIASEPVIQTETPQITIQVESINNKPLSTEESIVLVYNEVIETPKTENVVVEEKEDEKSFISKLFKEYQHFKYGEKVDLKTLGINRREVLAKVDERLFKEEREDLKDFVQSRVGRFRKIQE